MNKRARMPIDVIRKLPVDKRTVIEDGVEKEVEGEQMFEIEEVLTQKNVTRHTKEGVMRQIAHLEERKQKMIEDIDEEILRHQDILAEIERISTDER